MKHLDMHCAITLLAWEAFRGQEDRLSRSGPVKVSEGSTADLL